MIDILRSVGLNRYELNARLKPALLVLLPAVVVLLFWYPAAWSLKSSAIMVCSSCGVLYAVSQLSRYLGRQVERQSERRAGRGNTARLLLHSDETYAAETKERYHEYLRAHGRVLSTPEEETANPDAAFRRALSAVDWLLEHTRGGPGAVFLLDENIAYGFQRNLLGLKPIGLTLSIAAIAVHSILLAVSTQEKEMFWLGVVIWFSQVIFLIFLTFLVNMKAVSEASLAYAQRLLANCEATKRSSTGTTGAIGKLRRPAKPRSSSASHG